MHTDIGSVRLDTPRDRDGAFAPRIVPKGPVATAGFNDRIIALYARGMTVRDIQAHLAELYGVEVSPDLIAKVTAVLEEVKKWQQRPLERVYAAIYLDAIRCKVRHEDAVTNKADPPRRGHRRRRLQGRPCHLDRRHRGSKFWLRICNELKNRGVEDVIFVCCDGLHGNRARQYVQERALRPDLRGCQPSGHLKPQARMDTSVRGEVSRTY